MAKKNTAPSPAPAPANSSPRLSLAEMTMLKKPQAGGTPPSTPRRNKTPFAPSSGSKPIRQNIPINNNEEEEDDFFEYSRGGGKSGMSLKDIMVVMFKAIVLCALYNLSDDQVEYQIRDRLSFVRFLGLGLEDKVPDAKTVWLYREQLAQAGMITTVFESFDSYLKDQGYLAMGGQIIDASIVSVPTQHNKRDENVKIKAGEAPEGWVDKPAKFRQKDTHARWTKKHGKSHYGYKNHINVDRRHKLVRRYHVTDASVHDSQALNAVLDADNTASGVWADSAYRSAEIEGMLKEKSLTSHIHHKAHRNRPLTKRQEHGNQTRSKVRVRVEHIFGAQSNDMGGTLVRSIGIVRARARIGLKNLAYNMRRLVQLERLATAPP